jgi:glutaredoxin
MVTIWGKEHCSFCEKAKALCDQYELKYEYILIDGPEKFEQLQALLPDARTVPQIFWNGKHIGGYNQFALEVENTRNFGQEVF